MDLATANDGMYMVKVANVEIHKKYTSTTYSDGNVDEYNYDFAIFTLDCELSFDERIIGPVCLPTKECNNPSAYENEDVR